MRRGEVWWIEWAPEDRRPVVLLSGDGAPELRAMFIVPPADVEIGGYAIEVRVGSREGLPHEGVVRVALARPGKIPCAWLITLQRADLLERAGALSPAKIGRRRILSDLRRLV